MKYGKLLLAPGSNNAGNRIVNILFILNRVAVAIVICCLLLLLAKQL